MASRKTMDDVSCSESGYSSRFSSFESQLSTTLTSLKNPPSCKSHPISTIEYHQDGRLQSKNVEEAGLDSKVLSHVLSNDEHLEALNVNLKNLKLRLEKISENVSGVHIHVEEGTLENEKLEEMCRITQKYCQEQFKMYDYRLDDTRFSCADSKFKKFLDGSGNKVSIFFSEDKMSVVGHDEDIVCFRDGILTSVLHDEVITDSMNLDQEQFLYLNITHFQTKRKFSVDFELEDKTCLEKNGICSARFRGLKEDVVNAKREVRGRLEKYDKHFLSRQLNNNERLLFLEKRVNDHIHCELKRRNCSYLVVKDILYVASETQGVDSFKSYLENALFVEIKRTLCDLERTIFLSDEWVNKKYPLLRNNTRKKVIVSVFGNDLVATCLPGVREQVESSLEDFLNEKIKLKIVEWKCADDIKELCLSVKKEEIMEMLESKKDEMVSISLKDDGVHLRGTDIGINSCQAMLGSTIDDRKIYRTTFTASSEAVINQLSNPATKQRLQEIGKKTRCVINVKSHCKIIMKNGNIAEEDVDVIVNSVHTDTNFCARPSTVAKAIFEKGGTDFQNKLVQKTSGRMEYGHIAVTEGGGNLRCKAVYHACFDKTPTSQEEEVRKIAKMCLEKAARDGFTSLSFPALGTGVYNYSGAESAKGLFDAIIEFSDTNLLVKKIDIVLFEGARQDVRETYQREYRNRFCRDSTSALISLTKGCITAGNVTIVAENKQNIDNARKELENLLTALSTEDQQ